VNTDPDPCTALHKRTILHLLLILVGVAGVQIFLRTFAGSRPPMQNVEWWKALAAAMGKHGFFNVWTPYPPVFPALFYGLYRTLTASLLLPIWVAANICLLLGQAGLIFAIVRRISPGSSRAALHSAFVASFAFIVVMFQPRSLVLLGPWMDQFDYLPTFLLLLGLFLLMRKQEAASALVCGLGIMTKIFPGVLVFAAFAALGWKRGLRYGGIAAAVCVAVGAPFFIANNDAFLSTYRWSADRTPWESVWAYAFPGRGTRELLANLPEARSPALIEQQFAVPYRPQEDVPPEHGPQSPSNLVNRLTMSLTAVSMILTSVLVARTKDKSGGDLCRGVLVLVLIFLIFTKGFSSYFVVWAAPLICVAYPGAGGFALCALLILLGNTELMGLMARAAQVSGSREGIERFTRLGTPHVLFWRSIVYREMILIVVAGHQIVRLWKSREVTE